MRLSGLLCSSCVNLCTASINELNSAKIGSTVELFSVIMPHFTLPSGVDARLSKVFTKSSNTDSTVTSTA